jgi:hypothetical protein
MALKSSESGARLPLYLKLGGDVKMPEPFEFRSPHGINRVEHQSRCWNTITVRIGLDEPARLAGLSQF